MPLLLRYPYWDAPSIHEFSSTENITEYLSTFQHFLVNPITREAIHSTQVDKIDPDVIYDVVGSGLPPFPNMKREYMWDRAFERKATLALEETLENEDAKVKELPEVIKDEAGEVVGEWEALYELSDGAIVFLDTTKLRMSNDHIDKQSERISKSLIAMGKTGRAQLYLAAYYWPDDEDCISYACKKGYGVIQPTERLHRLTVTVHSKAKDLDFK